MHKQYAKSYAKASFSQVDSSVIVEAIFQLGRGICYQLPLYLTPVAAGFPSPCDDYLEEKLDLNQHLITHPAATFFVRAFGDSMIGAGIHSGDLLIVDRALRPKHRSIVIAVVNGELTVKRLHKKGDRLLLVAENEQYEPLEINEHTEFHIWGVVTNVIHSLC